MPRMVYSEERGTWNVFVGAEWYFEGDYEQCMKCMETFYWDENDDDYAWMMEV